MTGNSMESDLLVESRSHLMSTSTADGRQPQNNNNNTNNSATTIAANNSQTIGTSGVNSVNNTDNSRVVIMSHLRSSATLENGDVRHTTSGIANNIRPDLTLAIQENLKYGVGLPSGRFSRELLSRESRSHPATATSSLPSGDCSGSITSTNNTSNTNTTNTTTTTNNNNGVYANGSSSSGTVLLSLPGETRNNNNNNTTNMTPSSSLYVAFTTNSASASSTSTRTTSITGSLSTLNRCNNNSNNNNNNNHNGTTAQYTTTDLTSRTHNIASLGHLSCTSKGREDYPNSSNSSNNISNNSNINNIIHSNNSSISSFNNNNPNTPNNKGGPVASPGPFSLPISDASYYPKQLTTDFNNSSSRENKLKELILLHIDFIHHQQDLIIQKDKDISDLKSENETLKCRLDRMDRRLSILKQKGDPVNSHHPSPQSHPHHPHTIPKTQASSDGTTTTTTTTTTPGDRGSKKFNFLKRRERKFGVDGENVPKKKSSESGKSSSSKSHSLTKSQLSYRGGSDSLNRCQELSENGEMILRTDNLYYVSYYEPPFPSEKVLVNIRHTNDEINPDGSKVELPHWRLRPVANCYTLEGTENLEDEVFTKRHQKPELEEKRRKRWDLQRMREQKLFERLRERGKPNYPESMKDEPQYITSFYPSLDDITHIEIADKIPVTAFGHPIPYIKPTDFELPWELGEWPTMSSSSGDDSRHQKHRRVKRK